jgi:hypothetical protein
MQNKAEPRLGSAFSRSLGILAAISLVVLPIGTCVWLFAPSVTERWARARACEYLTHGGADLPWQAVGDGRWDFPDTGAGARRFQTGDSGWVLVIAPYDFWDYGYMLSSDGMFYSSIDSSGETNFSWGFVNHAASLEDLNPSSRPLGRLECNLN